MSASPEASPCWRATTIAMIALGGNIYFLAKLSRPTARASSTRRHSMTGMSQEDYAQMMLNGGQSPVDGAASCRESKRDG